MTSCVDGVCGTGGVGLPKPGDPSNDGALQAKGIPGGVELSWTMPATNAFAVAHTEVYRSISNQFINAIRIAIQKGDNYFDRVAHGTQYWYWIVHVSVQGTVMEPIGPATAMAYDSVAQIIEDITGRIDDSLLSQHLRERIASITLLEGGLLKEVQDRFGADSEMAAAVALLQSDVDGAFTLVQEEIVQRRDGDSALVDAMSLLGVKVDDSRAAILEEAQLRADADSALASRTTTVETTLNGNAATGEIGLIAKVDELGNQTSTFSVKLTAGNLIGGFGVSNDGQTVDAGFDVDTFFIGRTNADKRKPFIVYNGTVYMDQAFIRELTVDKITSGNMNAEWRMTGANARIVMNNGTVMKVIGTGFGAQGNLISWFGPAMEVWQCSTSNAITYETTTGEAYWGGTLRAGTLYNAQRTTQTAYNAEVPLGPFSSNGGVKNVVVSYSFTHQWESSTWDPDGYTHTGGTANATVELLRSYNNGPYVSLRTTTFEGNVQINNEQEAPDTAGSFVSGSFTLTDNVGAGNYTYLARITSRNNAQFSHPDGNGTLSVTQSLGIVSTEE